MEPNSSLRILLIEDSEDDAILLGNHLRGEGQSCSYTRIEDLAALRTALGEPGWDILLTDFNLPAMNGLQVLEEAGRLAPALPCILVSGQIGEEAAVESLRAGAKDFVSKSRLARLLPAIQREVHEAGLRLKAAATSAELHTAEGRFKAITDAALDGIVMMDPAGRISFWNQAAERIFGYTEAEALGADLHTLIAPARFHGAIEKGVSGFHGTGQGPAIGKVIELEGRRKDGSEFPVEFSLAALEEGGAWHAVGVVRDIAERKQAEQEIRRNEERFRAIFEQSPLGIALIDSVTGHIYEVNSRFAAIAGRTREAMATIDWMSITHPDDVQEDLDNMARLNAGEIPGFRMNKRYLKPDGAAVWISMTVAPTQVEDAARPCHLCMIEDITELKEAEEALRRNVSLYATIHRHVVDLIAIIDGHGRRLYTSPSYLFVLGYSQEEMQALSSLSLLHPEDHDRVAEALHGVMEGRPTQGLGYRLRHRDGRWLDFESKAAIIPDDGTGTARALVVARDVTERKASERNQAAMEVQLRQAQKLEAIGQLAAGIAHEINTPTQFIGDNTSFLRDAFQDAFGLVGKLAEHLTAIAAGSGREADLARTAMKELETADLRYFQDEIPKAIQQSLEGVGRISKIVKAMKDFSHPGGETKTLTDLHQAIESTITVSRNEWKYAANLVTEFDPDLPLVPCFPGEFNQVILNLIVNAAHAIEAAHGGQDSGHLGQIRVGTRLGRDEVLVFVTDDGTGIPAAVQARMFDPFYTTKAVGKGSGQGLAIAHAVIVEKHQGRITVESVLGQGTTFTLHLPLETPGQEGGAE